MKLLRHGAPGRERPALIDATGQVRDLSGVVPDIAGDVLTPAGLGRLAQLDLETLPAIPPERLGPCVGGVGKYICIGLNYRDHAAEAGLEPPAEPVIFLKATSAISGPNDDILIPRGSRRTDWEVELAVVIGTGGKYIAEEQALDHVAGYCVANDLSEREFQIKRGGQWDKGKGCDSFGPIGPWLVTADEVPDPQQLGLWLEVDGARRQNGNTRDMIFSVRHIVSYVSQFMSLQPGDVIATGTPAGVGMGFRPGIYLAPGNVVRLGIDGLGEQRQTARADA